MYYIGTIDKYTWSRIFRVRVSRVRPIGTSILSQQRIQWGNSTNTKYGNKSFIISFFVMVKHRFDVAPQQARHGECNNHLMGENKAFIRIRLLFLWPKIAILWISYHLPATSKHQKFDWNVIIIRIYIICICMYLLMFCHKIWWTGTP